MSSRRDKRTPGPAPALCQHNQTATVPATIPDNNDDALTAERYELREDLVYRFDPTRREFVHVLGAGMVIAVSSRRVVAQQRGRRQGRTGGRTARLTQRFQIGTDGIVTVFTGKVEVGQGSRTQITQAAAEELRLPVERICLVMADTQRCPDDGGTAGSRTTPSTVPVVRAAAAAAHHALTELAAKQLGVDASRSSFAMEYSSPDPVS